MSPETVHERIDRLHEIITNTIQPLVASVAVTAEAIKAHASQCEERERRRDDSEGDIRQDIANHRAFVDETIRRIEHDGRNVRMDVQSLAHKILPSLEALKEQLTNAQTERHTLSGRVAQISKLMWGALIGLVSILGFVSWWLITHYILIVPGG